MVVVNIVVGVDVVVGIVVVGGGSSGGCIAVVDIINVVATVVNCNASKYNDSKKMRTSQTNDLNWSVCALL